MSLMLLVACVALAFGQGNPGAGGDNTKYKAGNAWTLSYPLGFAVPSTIDTIPFNYQRHVIPSMVTDAYVTPGNLGSPGQTLLIEGFRPRSTFFFTDPLHHWLPTSGKQKFYNVYIPMTLAGYDFGGSRDTGQERLGATFAGSLNRRFGAGAFIDYLYSKGMYANQAAKDVAYGFNAYYKGDRYQTQAYFYAYNMVNKENGGITDPLYITDPAQLQGGVSKIDTKSIPVNLSDAHSRSRGSRFYMSHTYNVGFWRDVEVNDTLTRQEYVPVTQFIYSLDWDRATHIFTNAASNNSFWDHHYLTDGETYDKTSYSSLKNTIGISMIEGFQKWAKFGLSAYAQYELRRYTQANNGWLPPGSEEPGEGEDTPPAPDLTPLPEGVDIKPKASENLLWIGGRIAKTQGTTLRYDADVKFGLSGDVVGDLELSGNAYTQFRLLGDTVQLKANAHFRNTAQPYLLKNYISNHYIWQNDFGKTRSFGVGGELLIPWTDTRISAGWRSLQNYVFFNTTGLPQQDGGTVHLFYASVKQHLNFGIWNWDNALTYQTSSNAEVIPVPALTLYSNMYLKFNAFRVLNLQIGVDADYYTRYRGYNYEPATMTFRVGEDWKVGNFPFMNAYVTAKLYKVRFYVLYSHFNKGWFTKDYFAMPLYPVNPARLLFGLSVDFAD